MSSGLLEEDLFVVPDNLVQFCERLRQNSLSVGHYATVRTKKIFTESECENRNCIGTRSKLPLDPAKLSLVKKNLFLDFTALKTMKRNAFEKKLCYKHRRDVKKKTQII